MNYGRKARHATDDEYTTEKDSSGQYKVKWNVGRKGEQRSPEERDKSHTGRCSIG